MRPAKAPRATRRRAGHQRSSGGRERDRRPRRIEGMLATQMVATHFAVMPLLRQLKGVAGVSPRCNARELFRWAASIRVPVFGHARDGVVLERITDWSRHRLRVG